MQIPVSGVFIADHSMLCTMYLYSVQMNVLMQSCLVNDLES